MTRQLDSGAVYRPTRKVSNRPVLTAYSMQPPLSFLRSCIFICSTVVHKLHRIRPSNLQTLTAYQSARDNLINEMESGHDRIVPHIIGIEGDSLAVLSAVVSFGTTIRRKSCRTQFDGFIRATTFVTTGCRRQVGGFI